jgi:hypothetical protein
VFRVYPLGVGTRSDLSLGGSSLSKKKKKKSSGWCMIGRWTLSPLSSMFCILLGWVGELMINYVGCPRKEDLLRLNLLTRFFFLTLTHLSLRR